MKSRTKKTLSLLLALAMCLALLPAAALAADHYDGESFHISNINEDKVTQGKGSDYGVILYTLQNETSLDVYLTSVTTYHYNDGKGSPMGIIAIWQDDTMCIGAWQATGSDYMWTIYPDVILEGGHKYYFYDSSPETWSYNEGSGNVCFIQIDGNWTNGSAGGQWKYNPGYGYWYQYADGTYPYSQWDYIDGAWYHFDSRGYMQTGWLYDGGHWYYLGGNGKMITGWKSINNSWYYFDGNGIMVTGWQTIDGKEYYFSDSGDWVKDPGNTQGHWKYEDGGWRYVTYGGEYVRTRPYEIDGKWYWFSSDGFLRTGWYFDPSGAWYYFGPDGEMRVGWQYIDGNWYYFERGSSIYYSGWMKTGWRKIGGEWYYFGGDGAMRSNTWVDGYYLDENGVYQKNGPGSGAG